MKTDEAKSILESIRGAPSGDIAIVSFIFLPVLLASWSVLLNTLGVGTADSYTRAYVLGALIVVYLVAVFVMKFCEGKQSKMIRAGKHIRNRLRVRPAKNNGLGSFEYIRKYVNPSYTDEFLSELIEQCPEDFMRIKCTGDRPGLKLIEGEA